MPSEDLAHWCGDTKLNAHLPKEAHNPASSPVSNLESLGLFSILPRELRDEIYGLVCKFYQFEPPYVASIYKRGGFIKWYGCGLPMLQVSKAVREEFFLIFCSKGIFEFLNPMFVDKIQPIDIPFVDCISNIKIGTYLVPDGNGCYDRYRGTFSLKPEPVSFFGGTSMTRNICMIELYNCGPRTLSGLLSSPLMHALSLLTGFKTVQLSFFTDMQQWLKWDAGESILNAVHDFGTCPGFDVLVIRISTALEPTLGAFTVTREMAPYKQVWQRWSSHVTFHPQARIPKQKDGQKSGYGTLME